MNPAVAVYRADFAQAVRLIEAGAPADGAYPNPLPGDPGRRTTPLEEAVRAGEPELVRVLMSRGTPVGVVRRRMLACQATAHDDVETAVALLGHPPTPDECKEF